MSLDAPRRGGGHPALEFVHALLGPGDLDAAGIDREVQVAVLVGGLLTEQRHFLVVVDREDEVRRMAGRATRVGQRALVQQDEVGPAEAGQMAHQAVADDAGADDDDLGGSREVAHVGSPQCCCDAVSEVGDALGAETLLLDAMIYHRCIMQMVRHVRVSGNPRFDNASIGIHGGAVATAMTELPSPNRPTGNCAA